MVDRILPVVVPLIHEAVVVVNFEAEEVGLAEVVGLTFEAGAVLVEALVGVGNRGGKLSTCSYLS